MSEPYIKMYTKYFITPEYIDFFKRRKALVYYFLEASIIRGSNTVKQYFHPAFYTYKEHFLKGQLVSRYSQKKMEKYLGTSQGAISKYLKELEEDGFIKKIIRPTPKGNILYYQFGTWEGEYGKDTYKEIIWMDEHFTKIIDTAKNKTQEDGNNQATKNMMEYFEKYDDFELFVIRVKNEIGLKTGLTEDPKQEREKLRLLWDECKGETVSV